MAKREANASVIAKITLLIQLGYQLGLLISKRRPQPQPRSEGETFASADDYFNKYFLHSVDMNVSDFKSMYVNSNNHIYL